jgi:hypothetical protein
VDFSHMADAKLSIFIQHLYFIGFQIG